AQRERQGWLRSGIGREGSFQSKSNGTLDGRILRRQHRIQRISQFWPGVLDLDEVEDEILSYLADRRSRSHSPKTGVLQTLQKGAGEEVFLEGRVDEPE